MSLHPQKRLRSSASLDPTAASTSEPCANSNTVSDDPVAHSKLFAIYSAPATEADVGILEYLDRSVPAFTGTIKHRYEDFLVNEVDLAGNIVRFRYTDPTALSKTETQPPVEQPYEAAAEPETTEDKLAELAKLIGQESEILTIIRSLLDDDSASPEPILTKPITEKTQRTLIHESVRKLFVRQIDTETKDGSIQIRKLSVNEQPVRRQSKPAKRNLSFSERGGEYCHFTLYKENMDTMHVIGLIARTIRSSNHSFSFAGTKDKRAITTQRVSAHRIQPDTLLGLNKRLRGARIGDLSYAPEKIALGALGGNHFTIVLRDLQTSSEESVHTSLQSFKTLGFINYFGMQRFGTQSVPTYAPGISLLAGNWDEAVDLIMRPKGDEPSEILAARTHWATHRDPAAAFSMFPAKFTAERAILNAFVSMKNTSDSLAAIQKIPAFLKSMYLHAYQSLVWNHMASERIRLFGHRPVIGDLVMPKSASALDVVDDGTEPTATAPQANQPKVVPIVIMSDEQAAQYTMADVVLPTPGHAIVYPTNSMMDKYIEFMAKHGFDPKAMTRPIRDFSLPGSYRRVVTMPSNVSWKLLRYNDDNVPLVRTDLDLLDNKPEIASIPDGKHLALVVEFSLGSSQYATMALREITKMDTSKAVQHALSNENIKRKHAEDDTNVE